MIKNVKNVEEMQNVVFSFIDFSSHKSPHLHWMRCYTMMTTVERGAACTRGSAWRSGDEKVVLASFRPRLNA